MQGQENQKSQGFSKKSITEGEPSIRGDSEYLTLEGINQQTLQNKTENEKSIIDDLEDIQNANRAQMTIESLKQKIQGIDEMEYSFTPKNPINKDAHPSQQQIRSCLIAMETIFPKGEIQSIIQDLHKIVHKTCTYSQFKVNRTRDNMPRPLETYDKSSEEIKIALSFINHGYGLKVLRQKICDPNITSSKYNNTITSIMKITFRKLEQFMKFLGKAVQPLTSIDEKILRAPLINCDKWLAQDELQTFYKLIKAAYQLQKINITPFSVQKLYNSIIRQLNLKGREEKKKQSVQKDIKVYDDQVKIIDPATIDKGEFTNKNKNHASANLNQIANIITKRFTKKI